MKKNARNRCTPRCPPWPEVSNANTRWRRVLDNPVLPVDKKTELIRTAGGGRTSEVFDRFVWLVLHNRRERYLQSISLMYLDLYRKLNRISTGRLETAVPVTPETERKIIDLIASETNGKVELKTSVKPELLGGFVFEMDSERLDASIATQLRNIKKQFVEKNKRIV